MSENTNTAHRPAAPSPSAVAASMNAGRRKNANGRGNNSNGGGRRNSGKRRPLALRPFDELAARYSQDALAAGRDLFVTFLREAWADRRTGNRVYYSRETTLEGKTFVPFMHAYRQWWAGDGEFADGGDLADTRAGWRAGDNARTKASRAVYQKLRNARGLTGEEDMYRVAYAWCGNYPEKPSIGTHVLYNDGDTAYTLCRALTGPNAREVAQAIVRDTTGENGESWFIPVMQRLYDAGKHGIAKSGVFRSIARSYGVSTSQEAEKAITSYESFIEDCENNDGKNVKRLLGSGRLTPRVAAMARAAHEQLGCSGYYGKSLWLEIEARRDTWCDTDKKRAEFASHLFEFATPEQVLSWWWHANKYDAGYSHHGYGAYRENQGHYEMRWYAEDYDREARRRYPVGSAAFARLYNAGGAKKDRYKAEGLLALGCTLSDDDLYDLFKSVGGTTWHCGGAPFSERLWMEHVTNGGELTRLREVAENDGAMRVVPRRAARGVSGVRPQAWRVTSGYSSHSRVGEVVEKKQRNDLGYAAVAEINCRRYCEGGENWYRLTQLALDGDVSPLVERGYLSQADADNCEPLEAAARAFANAHFTPDMRGGRAVEELGEDAPTWEKLRLAYLIACAPAGGWRLAAPEEARACVHYRAYRSSSFRTIANKKFRDESEAYVSWLCERRYVPSGVDGVVVDRLLYQVDACVETAWSAGGGIFGRVVTPAGGFALSTTSDILGVAQATFSLHLIISKASIHGGYTVGGGDDDSDTWKVFKHPYAPTSVYEKGVDGQDAPIRAAGSADEAVALAVAGFPERGLGVFAPEVMDADGDFVMVYHKPLGELDDKFLIVGGAGE